MISVVIPTIDGREDHLVRCLAAYQAHTQHEFELIVIQNKPTCGIAWAEGADRASGDYIHFTADDLEPHEGWDSEVVDMVDRGILPSPRIIGSDGVTQFCGYHGTGELPTGTVVALRPVIPFLSRAMWDLCVPMFPGHYYTDDWIGYRVTRGGHEIQVCRSFAFTHHFAQVGRGAGMSEGQRMTHDLALYNAAWEAEQ